MCHCPQCLAFMAKPSSAIVPMTVLIGAYGWNSENGSGDGPDDKQYCHTTRERGERKKREGVGAREEGGKGRSGRMEG